MNGTLEEVLWRGTYQAVFPDAPVTGYLYPAVGFAVWHYAPKTIHPTHPHSNPTSLVATAGLVGLLWGWVGRRIGSVLSLMISHIVFDFSGLGARVYAKPPQRHSRCLFVAYRGSARCQVAPAHQWLVRQCALCEG